MLKHDITNLSYSSSLHLIAFFDKCIFVDLRGFSNSVVPSSLWKCNIRLTAQSLQHFDGFMTKKIADELNEIPARCKRKKDYRHLRKRRYSRVRALDICLYKIKYYLSVQLSVPFSRTPLLFPRALGFPCVCFFAFFVYFVRSIDNFREN